MLGDIHRIRPDHLAATSRTAILVVMERLFSVTDARAFMPEVRRRTAEIVAQRADLAELSAAVSTGASSPLGGVAEVKALEARLHEQMGWFGQQGIQVKGFAPVLVDFPALRDGKQILLCWLEGEFELAWWHRLDLGFAGRRQLERRSPDQAAR